MKKRSGAKLAKIGARLTDDLTVLAVIDGGSAEPVYLVWSHRNWCPMACKVMRSAHSAKVEAETIGNFAHPNVVRGLGIANHVHLLMPFIEGTQLSSAIDSARQLRLSVSNSMRLAIYVGAALIHIHDRGFLHMDVKPDNIIVGVDGRPTLFDFGSARRMDAERPSVSVGTNVYMAPEECRMAAVGTSADVFSLAVTIYEMLTGEVPFGRDTPADPFPQLSNDVIAPRKFRKNLPQELENLLFACLERDPAFRPKLAEILPQLHIFIEHGPPMWPADLDLGSSKAELPSKAAAKKSSPRRPRSKSSLRSCAS